MNNIETTVKSSVKGLINPENKLSLLPNWLSFSRAISGIIIPIMIHKKSPYKLIIATISFTFISDLLDGQIARKIVKEETTEGAMIDAISDKIFSLSLINGIVKESPVFLLNEILEIAISIINSNSLNKGFMPKSNTLGKLKVWPLSLAITIAYISVLKNDKSLMKLANMLSASTIILEAINIKEYYSEYKIKTKKC